MKYNNNKKIITKNTYIFQQIRKLMQALKIEMKDLKDIEDLDAIHVLACCFALSKNKKDKNKSIRYFFKAAKEGHVLSMLRLFQAVKQGQMEALNRLISIYNNPIHEKWKNTIYCELFESTKGQTETRKKLLKLLAQQDQ